MGGGISFSDTINGRLPFGSLPLAGLALLVIVAVPMTVASVAAGRGAQYAADIIFGAGLLLIAWIAVELAFIKEYSWFYPTYLAAALVVLGLGWLVQRISGQQPPGSRGRSYMTPSWPASCTRVCWASGREARGDR